VERTEHSAQHPGGFVRRVLTAEMLPSGGIEK
jgi:hypothetical protein